MKTLKNGPQKLLIIGPNLFFHSAAQATAHSPELVFHIINMSQSVSLSVILLVLKSNDESLKSIAFSRTHVIQQRFLVVVRRVCSIQQTRSPSFDWKKE